MTDALPTGGGLFDRRLLRLRRDRAARAGDRADFLYREAAEGLADRLRDIARTFPRAVELGCRRGALAERLPGKSGVETLIGCDISPGMARAYRANTGRPAVVADEAWLPLAEESCDLVLSNMALHWVEDLPGTLIQINRALVADGLFLAAIPGGDTLAELRGIMVEAETGVRGGAAPRVAPTVALRDAGGLLQRAGFALPVVDYDRLTVTYETLFGLAADLRAMGETAALGGLPRETPPRALFMEAARLYAERHAGPDGRIPATFDIVYMHGWAPHESQQKPMRPGGARHRLADALGTVEHSAGDTAKPH